jgi:hypothetical protein
MWNGFIARKHKDGRHQSLFDHAQNVAEISLATSHYPNTSKLLAYLHDLGKVSSAFPKYIESGGDRGRTPARGLHQKQPVFLIFAKIRNLTGLARRKACAY